MPPGTYIDRQTGIRPVSVARNTEEVAAFAAPGWGMNTLVGLFCWAAPNRCGFNCLTGKGLKR
jgi:hypothetical protein